jgi:serine/threonine-protein kinase RsbW
MTSRKKIRSHKYRLKLPLESANLEIIRDFVGKIAANMGFDQEEIGNIELAVDEAATNVLRHAYQEQDKAKQFILIEVTSYPDRIQISVIDRGKGFNPAEIKPPRMDQYFKQMRRGGLGLYLIRTLMDQVDFSINPGKRNEVRMTKYLRETREKVSNPR